MEAVCTFDLVDSQIRHSHTETFRTHEETYKCMRKDDEGRMMKECTSPPIRIAFWVQEKSNVFCVLDSLTRMGVRLLRWSSAAFWDVWFVRSGR